MLPEGMPGSTDTEQKVLVVDDDRDSAEALQLLLAALVPGLAVIVAFDGRQGADLARADAPLAAVILDMEMPVLDGWEAAVRIRAEAPGPVPILVGVSGNPVLLAGAQERGLIDHAMVKPIDTVHLISILEHALSARPARR